MPTAEGWAYLLLLQIFCQTLHENKGILTGGTECPWRPLGSTTGLFELMIIKINGLVNVTLNCREMTRYELNGDCLFRYFTEVDDIDETSLLFLVGDNQRRYTLTPAEPPEFTQTLLSFSEQNVQILTSCRKHLHTSVHGVTDEQMTTPICDDTTRADFLFPTDRHFR